MEPQQFGNFADGTHRDGVSVTDSPELAREWGVVIGAGKFDTIHIYAVTPNDVPVNVTDEKSFELAEYVTSSATVVAHVHTFDPNDWNYGDDDIDWDVA